MLSEALLIKTVWKQQKIIHLIMNKNVLVYKEQMVYLKIYFSDIIPIL